jgi:hypothetical protein
MVGGVHCPSPSKEGIAPMRTTLITISVAGLLAAGAGSAAARPLAPTARGDAARHAQAMRDQGAHDTAHVNASPAAPAVVRVSRAPLVDGGFDWADAGIGAGLAAALLLSAGGASALRHHQHQHLTIR